MLKVNHALDNIQDANQSMSLDDWLNYLKELRDELEIRIEATEADIERRDGVEVAVDDGIGDGGD